jgi:hypothetical protein
MSELQKVMDRLERWGGRLSEKLGDSVLGSSKTLPTSGAVPISASPIMLAQMKLDEAIAVDVSFAYPNMLVGPGLGPAVGGVGDGPLNPGNGFVKVTWGTKGGIQQEARIDGGNGWRYPFVASNITVEYFPVDDNAEAGAGNITVNQPRDLRIAAQIAPASGAPCLPLTKTVWFSDIAPGGNGIRMVPNFAYEYLPVLVTFPTTSYNVNFFTAPVVQLCGILPDGLSGNFPRYLSTFGWLPAPQSGGFVSLFVAALAPAGLSSPKIVFKLAL